MFTVSVLRQAEVVVGRRHLLNGAVGQGRRHDGLDADNVTKERSIRTRRCRRNNIADKEERETYLRQLLDTRLQPGGRLLHLLGQLVLKFLEHPGASAGLSRTTGYGRRDKRTTTGSELAAGSHGSGRALDGCAMFTWTRVGAGDGRRWSAGSGNPSRDGTIRAKHSGTGVEIARLPPSRPRCPPPPWLVGGILASET